MQFKLHSKLLSILLLSSLTSCAANTTATAPVTIHDFCLVGKAITFSEAHGTDVETATNKYDTPETIAQIKDHDLKWGALCDTVKGSVT